MRTVDPLSHSVLWHEWWRNDHCGTTLPAVPPDEADRIVNGRALGEWTEIDLPCDRETAWKQQQLQEWREDRRASRRRAMQARQTAERRQVRARLLEPDTFVTIEPW